MSRNGDAELSGEGSWTKYRHRIDERIATSRKVPGAIIAQILKTPDAFERWLTRKPSEAIVGDFYTPDDSVLANYLWEVLGVYVDVFDFVAYENKSISLPVWYRKFMRAENDYKNIRQNDGEALSPELTAAEALAIFYKAMDTA